jgi:hypothetical protein
MIVSGVATNDTKTHLRAQQNVRFFFVYQREREMINVNKKYVIVFSEITCQLHTVYWFDIIRNSLTSAKIRHEKSCWIVSKNRFFFRKRQSSEKEKQRLIRLSHLGWSPKRWPVKRLAHQKAQVSLLWNDAPVQNTLLWVNFQERIWQETTMWN